MSAKGELERLDQLGANAASTARAQNAAMNGRASPQFTAFYSASPGRHDMPMVGRLAVPGVVFMATGFILARGFGIAQPALCAVLAVIVVEALLFVRKRRKLVRLNEQSADLNAQLHDLKEQEFALRYEQAKADGQLDRFTKK